MMLHLAEAVAYLHTCGFIHRDIKRSNVRFTGTEAFLIDFDLAVKWQHGDAPLCERVGTRGWYAPEVATDTPCYGSEVDVWGLGLVQLDVLCQISKGESGPSGTCCVYVWFLTCMPWSHTGATGVSVENVYAAMFPAPVCASISCTSLPTCLQRSPHHGLRLTRSSPALGNLLRKQQKDATKAAAYCI